MMRKRVKLTSFLAKKKREASSGIETIEIDNVASYGGIGEVKKGMLCLYGAMETAEEIAKRRAEAEKKKLDYYSVSIELKFGLRVGEYVSEKDVKSGQVKFCAVDRMRPDFRESVMKLWHEWRVKKKLPPYEKITNDRLPCFDRVDFLDDLLDSEGFEKVICLAARIEVGNRMLKYAVLKNAKAIDEITAYGPHGTVLVQLPERIGAFKMPKLVKSS
ncbi:MAG: hypothetical protein ING19_17500 [Azospirillum sp.]|nr:hypothetical protein [Azospirillum sp.]